MSGTTIWVVSPDYGYEGLHAPRAAFLSQAEAEAYAKHAGDGGIASLVVNSVELMRFVPAVIEPATLAPVPQCECIS